MKKSVLILSIFIFLVAINFASAQNLLSDLLNSFDESMVILSAIFIIAFCVLFFSLSKVVFKDNTPIAGILSVVIAFLITYGINKTGFDFSTYFLDIGISGDVLMTIIPIVIVAGIILAIIFLKGASLFVFGGIMIALSFFVYEKTLLIVLGIIMLIVGLIVLSRTKKNKGINIPIRFGRD